MKWIVIGVTIIMVGSGCAFLDQMAGQSETIVGLGQSAGELAPVVAIFKPDAALFVALAGGLIVAFGKFVKVLGRK